MLPPWHIEDSFSMILSKTVFQAVLHERDIGVASSRGVWLPFHRRRRRPTKAQSLRGFGGRQRQRLRLLPFVKGMRFSVGITAGFHFIGPHSISTESFADLRNASRIRQSRYFRSFRAKQEFIEGFLFFFDTLRESLKRVMY